MPKLAIVRPIHLLPGREAAAAQWLDESEPARRDAGQLSQYLLRSIVDSGEFLLVQIWESRRAYDLWRESPDRQRLADERQRYLTHNPTRMYEIL